VDSQKLRFLCKGQTVSTESEGSPGIWDKTHASHMAGKWLISIIYKELLQLNKIRTHKCTKDLTRHSPRGDTANAQEYEKCSKAFP
jgi:hypothetical protein